MRDSTKENIGAITYILLLVGIVLFVIIFALHSPDPNSVEEQLEIEIGTSLHCEIVEEHITCWEN